VLWRSREVEAHDYYIPNLAKQESSPDCLHLTMIRYSETLLEISEIALQFWMFEFVATYIQKLTHDMDRVNHISKEILSLLEKTNPISHGVFQCLFAYKIKK
jgi:hypothetical protein